MGKIILLILIVSCLCVLVKLLKAKDKKQLEKETKKDKTFQDLEDESELSKLIDYLKLKIQKIESDSTIGIEEAKLRIESYKKKLEEAEKLKDKLNK